MDRRLVKHTRTWYGKHPQIMAIQLLYDDDLTPYNNQSASTPGHISVTKVNGWYVRRNISDGHIISLSASELAYMSLDELDKTLKELELEPLHVDEIMAMENIVENLW